MSNNSPDIFENLRKIGNKGREYWLASELSRVLGYPDLSEFMRHGGDAIQDCIANGLDYKQHFCGINEKGKAAAYMECTDIMLSRYGCYLTCKNDSSSKEINALGKMYFAKPSRRQELTDSARVELEGRKRLMLRSDVSDMNIALGGIVKRLGGNDYSGFQNEGYRGLYNGWTSGDLRHNMGLEADMNPLDYMRSQELNANLARIVMTEKVIGKTNLRRNALSKAFGIHREAGQEARRHICLVGGTMPEKMPVADKSIQQIGKEFE